MAIVLMISLLLIITVVIVIVIITITIIIAIDISIIPTAPRIPPDQYPRRGKMRGDLSLVGELHKLLSC